MNYGDDSFTYSDSIDVDFDGIDKSFPVTIFDESIFPIITFDM